MAFVPRYHPLIGHRTNSLLVQCAPNSPRDAWTWLAENPYLAAKSGLTVGLSGSPAQLSQVLYITAQQYANIKDQEALCVLSAGDSNFQNWHLNQPILLEHNLDNRLYFNLVSLHELKTEQEIKDAYRRLLDKGLVLLSEDEPSIHSSDYSRSKSNLTNRQSSPIPIPPRGHMKQRTQCVKTNPVLITLTRINNTNKEDGFY